MSKYLKFKTPATNQAGDLKSRYGLKNHGLTIVGESMDEIFRRVEGKLYQPVPMS